MEVKYSHQKKRNPSIPLSLYEQCDDGNQDSAHAHSEGKAHIHSSDSIRIDMHALCGHRRIDAVWCSSGYTHTADDHDYSDGQCIFSCHHWYKNFCQYRKCCDRMDADHGESVYEPHDQKQYQYEE